MALVVPNCQASRDSLLLQSEEAPSRLNSGIPSAGGAGEQYNRELPVALCASLLPAGMVPMSDILFGLRSNCSWFAGPETRGELVQRLKNAVVLHDQVGLQNGTFQCTVGERNSSEWFFPPGTDPDRSRVVYHELGSRWGIGAKPSHAPGPMRRLFSDITTAHFRADFYPILHEAGLTESEFIFFVDVSLDTTAKLESEKLARADHRNPELAAALPEGNQLRLAILKGLNYDAVLSLLSGVPIHVDPHCVAAINHKVSAQADRWTADGRGVVHATCVELGLPDFGELEWDEVCKIRESAAGRDYREMIGRLGQQVVEMTHGGLDQEAAEQEAWKLVSHELVEELTKRRPGVGSLAFDVLLNLVPYGGVFGTAESTADLVSAKRSWISLLRRRRE